MFAFSAVPSLQSQHAMLPASFTNAVQLRLRLPLTLLQGITTCKCGCAVDGYGDHVLSCIHFTSHRTPWHDLIVDKVRYMSSTAAFHVSNDANRPRAVSRAYSPNWCPDLTLIHGSHIGSHVLVDVTCTSVVATGVLPAASHTARIASVGAAASKLHKYGNVQPHNVLPFVVEHAGALGKEAMEHFRRCRKLVSNKLTVHQSEISTWSSRGFSNFFLQALSVANVKGLGHFFMIAANILRAG